MIEVMAWFNDEEDADRAVDALKEAGLVEDLRLLGRGVVEKEVMDPLEVPESQGRIRLSLQVDEARADTARTILNNAGAAEIQPAGGSEAQRDRDQDPDMYDNPFTVQRLHGNQ